MTEIEVLKHISEQLQQLQQLEEVLHNISEQLNVFYQGGVLFLGVISGILLGLVFWLMLKEN